MASSLVGKIETDVDIKASPEEFHTIFKHRPHHISNVSSDKIQGCELHEGEWGTVGSVIYWKYFHDGKDKVAKEIVEAVDEKNNLITFRVIEGDLMEHYKTFKITVHCLPKPQGKQGSIVHWTLEYEKLHNEIIDPHTLVQFCVDVSKDLDVHLSEDQTSTPK
ncbi:hypothetical protein FNV43_RR26912 [Rhamnella rubrinervis]|uniref:Bet v I/Major latex protein domain-containing protein n=1 Tax=Rhamnella rubrinervis TaxID=2594499 RepID=A0A8K0DNG3_9ROSA|nr:hypothetical protein FNV43_RR26912 [Rhamnella rubrinervis]